MKSMITKWMGVIALLAVIPVVASEKKEVNKDVSFEFIEVDKRQVLKICAKGGQIEGFDGEKYNDGNKYEIEVFLDKKEGWLGDGWVNSIEKFKLDDNKKLVPSGEKKETLIDILKSPSVLRNLFINLAATKDSDLTKEQQQKFDTSQLLLQQEKNELTNKVSALEKSFNSEKDKLKQLGDEIQKRDNEINLKQIESDGYKIESADFKTSLKRHKAGEIVVGTLVVGAITALIADQMCETNYVKKGLSSAYTWMKKLVSKK